MAEFEIVLAPPLFFARASPLPASNERELPWSDPEHRFSGGASAWADDRVNHRKRERQREK